ncbi:hypothetical protein J6R97_05150 [bacterium]|nr:hypothetical protein [bacterium]
MVYQINGSNGIYDNQIKDSSVKYGRNAVNNNIKHIEAPLVNDNRAVPPIFNFSPSLENHEQNFSDLELYLNKNDEYLNSLPPLEYEYRYLPNFTQNNLDKKALLAVAYEEFGQKTEMSIEEFEDKCLFDDTQTAEPLDINNDKKIDIGEYSANILATDILSKGTTNPMEADGVINNKGMNAIVDYSKKINADAASKLYKNIYTTYNLNSEEI